MGTFKNRVAKIVTNETVKADLLTGTVNSRNITVNLNITGSVPMIVLNPGLLLAHRVNAVPTVPRADGENVNTISSIITVDGALTERFSFVGEAISSLTGMLTKLYYDSLHSDIIIIPDLLGIGTNPDEEVYENGEVTLNCLRVGAVGDALNPTTELTLSVDEKKKFNIPATNKLANINVVTATLPGISDNGPSRIRKDLDADTTLISSRANGLTQFLELGTTDDLFSSLTTRIPMFNVLQSNITSYNLTYAGLINPAKVYIPLNF